MAEPEAQGSDTPLQHVEEDPVDTESVEEPEDSLPAPKRGRPKGSKDAQPRTRTKPEPHTPSKQCAAAPEYDLAAVMENAREQDLLARDALYQRWLPYYLHNINVRSTILPRSSSAVWHERSCTQGPGRILNPQ